MSSETVRAIVRAEIRRFADDVLAEAIGKSIGMMARESELRFAAKLEETTKEFAYKGQWADGGQYKRGNFVSMGGQVYHANADTSRVPALMALGLWPARADAMAETAVMSRSQSRRLRHKRRGVINDDSSPSQV